MYKIVVLDSSALPEGFALQRPDFAHEWVSYKQTAYAEIVPRSGDADMVLTSKCLFDAQVLAALPQLKYIGCLATGYNNIDVREAARRGIAVTNAQGYSTEAVAEHTVAMMFYLCRNFSATTRAVRAGSWPKSPTFWQLPGGVLTDLKGLTLTIVGCGAIGRRIAQLAEVLGMTVLRAEHKGVSEIRPGYTEFAKAISCADVISVNCPLSADTTDLIARTELAALKPNCVLINNSRGGIVNEQDLAQALRAGKLGGAGFDVASSEPLPADHPFMSLLDLDNFILTPHQAWLTRSALTDLCAQVKENLEAFVAGRRLRRVES